MVLCLKGEHCSDEQVECEKDGFVHVESFLTIFHALSHFGCQRKLKQRLIGKSHKWKL